MFCVSSETVQKCAVRETKEETGLKVVNIHFGTVVNAMWTEPSGEKCHFVTPTMICDVDSTAEEQEPVNLEPHKCEGLLRQFCKAVARQTFEM